MRVVVILHGMAAALTLAAAIHVWILLPRPRPPRGAALGFLICLIFLYGLGWLAYPEFRIQVRRELVADVERQWLANFFDVKEFLSWGGLMAGLTAAAAGFSRKPLSPEVRGALRGLLAFVMAVIVFCMVAGIMLSRYKLIE